MKDWTDEFGCEFREDEDEIILVNGQNLNVESYVIPDGVTEIGSSAFENCIGLKRITIPNSVTEISSGAFSGCTGLVYFEIRNSTTKIGTRAFEGCTCWMIDVFGCTFKADEYGITLVDIGDIDPDEEYRDWEGYVIPAWVDYIGQSAFSGCTGLKSITIPDSVTEIDECAFEGCTGLREIIVEKDNDNFRSIDGVLYDNLVSKLIRCPIGIKIITIPDSVIEIDECAFSDCTELQEIVVEKGNDKFRSIDGVLYDNSVSKLIRCPIGLENITIPNSVKKIGYRAFENCIGLKSITIPDSVTEIGLCAFYGCAGLESITLSNSVTEIGWWTFEGCTGLNSITIPDSVTEIGWFAFEGCIGLNSITIPDSVTEIGNCAFKGCTSLTSVTLPETVKLGEEVFKNCPNVMLYWK